MIALFTRAEDSMYPYPLKDPEGTLLVTTTVPLYRLLSVLHKRGRLAVPTDSMFSWVEAQTPASAYWVISMAVASPSRFTPSLTWDLVHMRVWWHAKCSSFV